MSEIGLFPLGLVLLPGEQVPLHIFEARYQELIGESLERGTPFGVVYADDDGLRQVGTLASVTEVSERFDDGRLNVVVVGGRRFRLLALTSGRSFVTASVEPFADQDDPADGADIERALALFGRLVDLTGSELDSPDPETPDLSFAVAAASSCRQSSSRSSWPRAPSASGSCACASSSRSPPKPSSVKRRSRRGRIRTGRFIRLTSEGPVAPDDRC